MTNYEFIMSLDVESLAELLTSLIHERDLMHQRQLAKAGIGSDLIGLAYDLQKEVHIRWLESEFKP